MLVGHRAGEVRTVYVKHAVGRFERLISGAQLTEKFMRMRRFQTRRKRREQTSGVGIWRE